MSNDQSGAPQNPGQQPPAYPGAPVPPQPPTQGPSGAPVPPQQPIAQPYPGAAPTAPGYPQQQPPVYGQPQGYAPPQGYAQPYGQPYPAPAKSNGLAIASMICGIASVVFCWAYLILPLLAGVPAVIMGHMSLKKIRNDSTLGGKALAITGLITGYVGIALGLIIGALIIIAIVAAFSCRDYSYSASAWVTAA